MPHFLKYLLATFRLSKRLVCEMSRGLGHNDFHDWPDSHAGAPWMCYEHRCKRCGKAFSI
jgi:hypothetical protein